MYMYVKERVAERIIIAFFRVMEKGGSKPARAVHMQKDIAGRSSAVCHAQAEHMMLVHISKRVYVQKKGLQSTSLSCSSQ